MMAARSILIVLACALLASCAPFKPREARPMLGEKEWVSYDGKVMPWHATLPPHGTKLKGVVITIHGLSGAASDFWLLHERLPPQGFAVYGYELRGQGNDPDVEARGDIHSSRQWLRDLETFHLLVKRRHPKAKVFWYGESLGSLIAFHTTTSRLRTSRDPDGIILASPVAGLRMAVSDFRKWLLNTAAALTPRQRYTLGELAGVDESRIHVTSTSTHGGQMAKTPHHVESFTLRLLAEIGRLLDENPKSARRLRLPVLFLASPNDVLSSPDQVHTLFQQIGSEKKTLHWYTRSYHLLLHDVQHEDVAEDILKWLNKRMTNDSRAE
jgi:alpha-beta hydrolase superfamily lysophospholipase